MKYTLSRTAPVADISKRRAIAEEKITGIQWQADTWGFCPCPFEHLHENASALKHCRVFIDGAPNVDCRHDSCNAEITTFNFDFAHEIGFAERGTSRAVVSVRATPKTQKPTHDFAASITAALPGILGRVAHPLDEITKDSPITPPSEPQEQFCAMLARFNPDDILWLAPRVEYSGSPKFAWCFKSAEAWAQHNKTLPRYICANPFTPGSISRGNDFIAAKRFLIVESDTLSKADTAAIILWLRDVIGMELAAVVDTGGKSLHAWFKYPSDEDFKSLRERLPLMGIDDKPFKNPSQPVRMPGAVRDDGKTPQTLIYLGKTTL